MAVEWPSCGTKLRAKNSCNPNKLQTPAFFPTNSVTPESFHKLCCSPEDTSSTQISVFPAPKLGCIRGKTYLSLSLLALRKNMPGWWILREKPRTPVVSMSALEKKKIYILILSLEEVLCYGICWLFFCFALFFHFKAQIYSNGEILEKMQYEDALLR